MTESTLLYTSAFEHKFAHAKSGDVGMDLPCVVNKAAIDGSRRFDINGMRDLDKLLKFGLVSFESTPKAIIPAMSWATFPTGINVKTPDDAWLLITGRSSSFFNYNLIIMQGVIDSGYTGELMTRVYNSNNTPFTVCNGDHLAQAIIIPRYSGLKILLSDALPVTERGNSGFGSSSGGENVPICGNIHEGKRGQKES